MNEIELLIGLLVIGQIAFDIWILGKLNAVIRGLQNHKEWIVKVAEFVEFEE